jgi:hypothetical protein
MESYLIRGNELLGPVHATVEPSGDIIWSHGFTSRKERPPATSVAELDLIATAAVRSASDAAAEPVTDASTSEAELHSDSEAAATDAIGAAEVSVPFKLAVNGEEGLVATFFGRFSGPDHTGRQGRTWILHSLGVGDLADAMVFMSEGSKENCIIWKVRDEHKVALEVDKRVFEHGSRVWLWNDAPPVPAEHHSRFTLHEDGRISPHMSTPGRTGDEDLVLGLEEPTILGTLFGKTAGVVLVPRGHTTELKLKMINAD